MTIFFLLLIANKSIQIKIYTPAATSQIFSDAIFKRIFVGSDVMALINTLQFEYKEGIIELDSKQVFMKEFNSITKLYEITGTIKVLDIFDKEVDKYVLGECCVNLVVINFEDSTLMKNKSKNCIEIRSSNDPEAWRICFESFKSALKLKYHIEEIVLKEKTAELDYRNFFLGGSFKPDTDYFEQCLVLQVDKTKNSNQLLPIVINSTTDLKLEYSMFAQMNYEIVETREGVIINIPAFAGILRIQGLKNKIDFKPIRIEFEFNAIKPSNQQVYDAAINIFFTEITTDHKGNAVPATIMTLFLEANALFPLNDFVKEIEATQWKTNLEQSYNNSYLIENKSGLSLLFDQILDLKSDIFAYRLDTKNPCESQILRVFFDKPLPINLRQYDHLKSVLNNSKSANSLLPRNMTKLNACGFEKSKNLINHINEKRFQLNVYHNLNVLKRNSQEQRISRNSSRPINKQKSGKNWKSVETIMRAEQLSLP